MKRIFLLAVVLVAPEAFAVFSAFVHITPETQEKHEAEVCVYRGTDDSAPIEVAVTFSYRQKPGWLITTNQYLDQKNQEFRHYIWDDSAADSPIEAIHRLDYDEGSPTIRVEVARSLFMRSYLYFDSPEPIFDGGFYYSVDLATYADVSHTEC